MRRRRLVSADRERDGLPHLSGSFPQRACYIILRGTNYPVQVTDDPYTYVLSTGLTNTVSPHYTAAYIAQFFSGTNGGLYPFITDSNQLLGASQPMVLEALSKSATLYVPDMMIAADVDRDGVVNFTNRADRTATNSPFVFWINDDADSGDDDAAQDLNPLANPVNSANSTIDGLRDLEDFARLQFKITALPKQFLTNGNYQVRVYLTNLVGSPSIRLFPAVESNGGLGYLTNSTMANAQVIASALGVLASGVLDNSAVFTALMQIAQHADSPLPLMTAVAKINEVFNEAAPGTTTDALAQLASDGMGPRMRGLWRRWFKR